MESATQPSEQLVDRRANGHISLANLIGVILLLVGAWYLTALLDSKEPILPLRVIASAYLIVFGTFVYHVPHGIQEPKSINNKVYRHFNFGILLLILQFAIFAFIKGRT